MSRDEAKRALETIDILKEHNTYTEADAITIINNLMKRSFADGKQYVKDQQENAKEYWKLISDDEVRMPVDFDTYLEAEMWRDEMHENEPDAGWEKYRPKLFREVMDND